MSLKESATRGGSSFAVPLSEVVTLRDEIDQRTRALRSVMPTTTSARDRAAGSLTSLQSVREELSGMISATRAAGKRSNSPADDVLNRAAARLVQRMAEDLDDNAATLMDRFNHGQSIDPLSQQNRLHAAQTSEAEASRLWHVLTVFMEHTGLGPEDLNDASTGRKPRQASDLKHRDSNPEPAD
ncbi:hypothetical protein [Corynebacterium glyciniphilum]|uniref:hypothetical protein n=1 Tax=Corynebacterium glyciniphilum TaxID=1404244 RepID=UPI003FD13B1A